LDHGDRTETPMPTEGKRIDFFDVDHTITRHATGWNFARFGIKRKLIPLRALVVIPFFFLQYRFGRFNEQVFHNRLDVFKGLRKSDLEEVARESFEKRLRRDINADAHEYIRKLKEEGRTVVLATSSLHVIVKPLADFLGIDIVIASQLQYEDGVCTGRFLCPPVFGREKMKRVLSYIEEAGTDVSLCSFYSDSYHDIPLLEVVANPVAVNPDYRLKKEALRRGWKIWMIS